MDYVEIDMINELFDDTYLSTSVNVSLTVRLTQKYSNQVFDLFLLNNKDLECYKRSVQNSDWAYPCEFLKNKTSVFLGAGSVQVSISNAKNVTAVINNTPFPNGITKSMNG